jgi:hypothetical protein
MVPRSHSLAMVRAVSMAAMTDMITATRPGTIMCRLSRLGLYHVRGSRRTGGVIRRPPRAASRPCLVTMASAKFWAMVAVLASLPSSSS